MSEEAILTRWRKKWSRFRTLPFRKKIDVLKSKVGIFVPTADRVLLEKKIFPWIREQWHPREILFVGSDSYTRDYDRHFPDSNFHSIDKDAAQAKFGSKHHVVGDITELGKYFSKGTFDVIVMNGVYGWGLDNAADVESAMRQCFEGLKPGGLLLLGWNQIPERNPLDLETIRALRRFERFPCALFEGQWRYEVLESENRHTYDFYLQPKS